MDADPLPTEPSDVQDGDDLAGLLDRMESLLTDAEALDPGAREITFGLLDGIDAVHRIALRELADELDIADIQRLRAAHPAIAWLFDAYAVGVDERASVEASLNAIRPYIDSHGGQVEVLDVRDGVVTLEMAGACVGCTASAITLQDGIVEALRNGFRGFDRVEVVDRGHAAPHPPPGPTLDRPAALHQIRPLRALDRAPDDGG